MRRSIHSGARQPIDTLRAIQAGGHKLQLGLSPWPQKSWMQSQLLRRPPHRRRHRPSSLQGLAASSSLCPSCPVRQPLPFSVACPLRSRAEHPLRAETCQSLRCRASNASRTIATRHGLEYCFPGCTFPPKYLPSQYRTAMHVLTSPTQRQEGQFLNSSAEEVAASQIPHADAACIQREIAQAKKPTACAFVHYSFS